MHIDSLEGVAGRGGFDHPVVENYLRERLEGLPEGRLEMRQFSSGASNLTYLLRIGDWEGVLRRPPSGPLPPKAHDMGREYRVLSHVWPVFALAPRPYLFCEDPSLVGTPFFIMEHRKGTVIDSSFPEGFEPTPKLCRALSGSIVDTLVDLHEIDWQTTGLGGLGKPNGFLERQVKSWVKRYDKAKTAYIKEVGPLADWLAGNVPESPEPTIIHNDYKLNNLVLNPSNPTEVLAVLDWEMATVGDPLFDLAVSLSYWVEPNDPQELREFLPTVTQVPGFMTREELMIRYAEGSGRDLSAMHWYLTLGYFKLAVIGQQIHARTLKGATRTEHLAGFGERIQNLIRHAYKFSRREVI